MKIPDFKEFGNRLPTMESVLDYLKIEHSLNLRELITGLKNLDFQNNFQSFEVTVTIPATTEIAIENKLRNAIPSKRLIVRSNVAEITDGAAEWTRQFVSLKNTSATPATVTVIFLK